MWLDDGRQLLRVVTIGLPLYLILILMLRVFGTRAMAKMNAFDSIVSVALGSALATGIMTQGLPGALALASILLLLVLQFVISWLAVRLGIVERVTRATPRLLLLEGAFLDDAMRSSRLTRGAVRAAVRGQGISRLEDVHAVVLETDGSLSVLRHTGPGEATALEGVDGTA